MAKLTRRDQREAETWVMLMLDAPEAHQRDLEKWVNGKTGRQELYDQILTSVRSAGDAAAAEPFETRTRNRAWHGSYPPLVAVAAVILIIAGAGLLWTLARSLTESGSLRRDTATALLSTTIGEVRQVRLEDGSRVMLDTGTILHVRFSSNDRVIELERGRARFFVAHDERRPFIVQADHNEVVATGTIFDVAYRHRIAVHLLQGSVDLRFKGWRENAKGNGVFHLKPGEQISFISGQSAPVSAMSARPSDEQWITGVKSFDDVPINDVITEANSYSEKQIVLADPQMGKRAIFGNIHIRDIDAVAQAIATFLEARIDLSQPDKMIITK